MSNFIAYLSISLVVIGTPGLDTALTIRNTLLGGRSGGLLTALGIAGGQTIWATATSAGILAVLTAAEPVFFLSNMLAPPTSSISASSRYAGPSGCLPLRRRTCRSTRQRACCRARPFARA